MDAAAAAEEDDDDTAARRGGGGRGNDPASALTPPLTQSSIATTNARNPRGRDNTHTHREIRILGHASCSGGEPRIYRRGRR
uniref:Uncharacterized protein n=1 Tax=Arundo donax TaxID=35708 RepID=A0A0A9H0L0_ARUDO